MVACPSPPTGVWMMRPVSLGSTQRHNPSCRPALTSSQGECASRSRSSRSVALPTRSRFRGRVAWGRRRRWPALRASSTSTSRGTCRKFGSAAVSWKHSRWCRSTSAKRRSVDNLPALRRRRLARSRGRGHVHRRSPHAAAGGATGDDQRIVFSIKSLQAIVNRMLQPPPRASVAQRRNRQVGGLSRADSRGHRAPPAQAGGCPIGLRWRLTITQPSPFRANTCVARNCPEASWPWYVVF